MSSNLVVVGVWSSAERCGCLSSKWGQKLSSVGPLTKGPWLYGRRIFLLSPRAIMAWSNGQEFIWAKSCSEFHCRNKYRKCTWRIKWFTVFKSTLHSLNSDRYGLGAGGINTFWPTGYGHSEWFNILQVNDNSQDSFYEQGQNELTETILSSAWFYTDMFSWACIPTDTKTLQI